MLCCTVFGYLRIFNSNRGVRQGTIFRLFVFSLFLSDLEDHLLADQVNGIPVEYKT